MHDSDRRAGEVQLERAVSAARDAALPEGHARIAAARAVQAAAEAPRARGVWLPIWAAASTAVAATLAVAFMVSSPAESPTEAPLPTVAKAAAVEPMQVGPRVAVAPAADSRFLVRASSAERTELTVTAGSVTARLFHGDTPHALRLDAAELSAVAVGTVYTVGFTADGAAFAHVHEGVIEVGRRADWVQLSAGQTWPAGAVVPGDAWAEAVTALSSMALQPLPTVASSAVRAPKSRRAATSPPRPPPAPAARQESTADENSAVARWRRARLLRGQGEDAAALALLAELAASDDPTWAPLALIEQMRIHAAAASEPQRIVALAESFLTRFPEHRLEREVRGMHCRAAAAAGGELPAECSAKP